MTYKLIALDMDGTVLDDDQLVSADNKKWIQKALEQGVTVCFATGRELRKITPYMTEIGMETPIVAVNGSEVWENPQRLMKRHTIDDQWVEKFVTMAQKHDLWIWVTAVEGKYNLKTWDSSLLGNHQWLKFGFHTEHDDIRKEIYEELAPFDVFEITNSHPHNLEFNPKGINKAFGLNTVCELLDIDMSQVLAMGDSTNDVAMLRAAGLGVAMGNAQDEVKDIADLVTVTNNENGVAKIIREVVLG